MPPRRGRPRKGDQRIDAAIDHFKPMGYAVRDIRDAVADLLKIYGGPSAWHMLEEGSYQAVQDKLFEKEEEEKEKQKQEQPQLLEGQQGEEEPPQHQESAVDEAGPEHRKSIFLVRDEVPADNESAKEGVEDPMLIEPPPPIEVVVPQTVVIGTGRKRRPCYGWLSESEDEEEL